MTTAKPAAKSKPAASKAVHAKVAASKVDALKPGQNLKIEIVKRPKSAGGVKTLERLMRMDPATIRGLRLAHKKRMQGLVVYNRGNRDWTKRESCGKLVRVVKGETWTLPFTAEIARDLKSVEGFVTINHA